MPLVLPLLLFLPISAFSASSVTRDLPEGYVAGTTFQVKLTVIPDHVYSLVIRETLPEGWSITAATPNYDSWISDTNTYKWLNYSQNRLDVPYYVTYTVSVPSGTVGNKTFSGYFVDDYGTFTTTGDTLIVDNSTVSTPQFSPPPGTYNVAQTVTITCATAGATIRYTTDGTNPDESSLVYTAPLVINTTTTLKARAWKTGMNTSLPATGLYTILETVANPSFSPAPGAYSSSINVSLSCATSGAILRYTTDGTEPTESSLVYSAPITISSTTTIKVKGFKEGMNPSSTVVATYFFPFGLVTLTNTWTNFYGDATINSINVEPGDMIAAFDPQGVCCGTFPVTTSGNYGFMPVYGDDTTTSGSDEGAQPGDTITFKIWKASENRIYLASTLGPDTPTWQEGLNRHVNLNGFNRWRISLSAGWNLISFPIKNCYYDSASPPAIPMLTGVNYVKVNSLSEVLTSIAGKYIVVRGFDVNGAKTFDPLLPQFSTLHYLAPGYGYWIKMNEPGTLELEGEPVDTNATITLNVGWNLVGYWANQVYYDSSSQPSVSFPEGVSIFTRVSSISEVLSSINGYYTVVRGFDVTGAKTFDPLLPQFSTLHYFGPGYGYWIKMNQSASFRWP